MESKTYKTIIYRGNQIREWSDGTYSAYVMDRYEDIEEITKPTLEEAKKVIDNHIKGEKGTL